MISVTGGLLKHTILKIPRPTSGVRVLPGRIREAVMSMLLSELSGAIIWDLFAGSGSFGIEALSRGARGVVFFECHRNSLNVLHKNLQHISQRDTSLQFQVKSCDLMQSVWGVRSLGMYACPDIVFADPPYTLTISWLKQYFICPHHHPKSHGMILLKASLHDKEHLDQMIEQSESVVLNVCKRYGDHLIYCMQCF